MEEKVVRSRRSRMKWKDFISASIYSPLIIIQFILTFFFFQNYYGFEIIMYAGLAVWILSACFGIAPIVIFKRRGGVPKGKGYVHTTKLVTDGLYGIVRHPQYTAGLLLILAMMMISQHWIVVIAGMIAFAVFYYDITLEDKGLIKIFGKPYKKYMKRVPRTNFVWGLVKAARRKRRHSHIKSKRMISQKKIGERIQGVANNVGPHGARTGQAYALMIACPECGRKIPPHKDCSYCGYKIKA